MAAFTTARSFSLYGNGMFSPLVSGSYTGLFQIPNVTALDYQPQATSQSIIGKDLDNNNTSLDTINQGDDLLVNISHNRFNNKSMAIDSMGSDSEITAGSGSTTDELTQIVGGVFELQRMNVSSVVIRGVNIVVDDTTGFSAGNQLTNNATGEVLGVIEEVVDGTHLTIFLQGDVPVSSDVITDDGGSTTATVASTTASNALAVEDTDFTVSAVNGRVTVISAGSLDLSALTSVKVNYSYTKLTGSQILVNTNTILKGEFVFKGINQVDSKSVWIRIPQLNLTPSSALALIGDDRSVSQLQGVAEKLSAESAAIFIEIAE